MPNVVYTGGTFDLMHEGHIELLRSCKRLAGDHGYVVVGLNTDDFIQRFKSQLPVMSYRERKIILESCKYVDLVIGNYGEEDSTKTIDSVADAMYQEFDYSKPVDIVAIGTDWAGRDYYGQMGFTKDWLDERDIILVYVDRRTGQSTTKLKEQLKK